MGVEVEEVEGTEGAIKETVSTQPSPGTGTPSSPAISDFTDDNSLPPTSDVGVEFVDDTTSEWKGSEGWTVLKRKCSGELAEVAAQRKVAKREDTGGLLDDEAVAATDDEGECSRSAAASRRLMGFARSGELVVDEGKKSKFEEKKVSRDGRWGQIP